MFTVFLWPLWGGQTVGGEGGSWETGEAAIALVQVSDDGGWTRVGTKEVERKVGILWI